MIGGLVVAALLFVGAPGSAGDDGGPARWVDQYTTFGCAPGGGNPVFADRVQPDRTKRLNQVIADCPEDLWGPIVMSRAARVDVTQDQLLMLANHARGTGAGTEPDRGEDRPDPTGDATVTGKPGEVPVASGDVSAGGTNVLLMLWLPALLVLVMVVDVLLGRRRARRSAAAEPAPVASARGHEENVPYP